ncbi:MAG TPA: hypothetical protein ENK91_13640 [Bacteroidetes bacterium]|nr:hypothetical protein [Bacteroidota bacterium]
MGLSIAYTGRLKEAKVLPDMIEEIVDIVKIYDWQYTVFEDKYPEDKFYDTSYEDVYGIIFSPPKSEPVFLTFLFDGRMVDPFLLKFIKNDEERQKKDKFWVFTKTQYAGIEVHKVIIRLFRYLSDKYLDDFEMSDDSRYWETDDEAVLQESFERFDFIMDKFAEALDEFDAGETTDKESLVKKLLEYLKNKFGDEGFDQGSN